MQLRLYAQLGMIERQVAASAGAMCAPRNWAGLHAAAMMLLQTAADNAAACSATDTKDALPGESSVPPAASRTTSKYFMTTSQRVKASSV